jgi:hypothetical protein
MFHAHPSFSASFRRGLSAVVCVLLAVTVSACSAPAEDGPRRLTTSESEVLSAARFRNYDAGTRRIDVTIAGADSTTTLSGSYDFVAHAGLVQVVQDDATTPNADGFTNLLWWTTSVVGEAIVEVPAPDWEAGTPPIDPAWEWEFYELDPAASTLITTLAMVSATGADRPDNPQLLAQSDALWLESTDEGVWFQLPSSDELTPSTVEPGEDTAIPRFLVSDSGVIERVTVTLPDSSTATIAFGPSSGDGVPLPDVSPGEK